MIFSFIMSERRLHKRLNINLPVTLRYRGDLIPATALNISCGGICLATEETEVIDDNNVEVIIDLAASELDVSVRGKIVRVSEGRQKKVGIQFTNLYSIGHQTIEKFIQKHKN